MLNSIGSNLRKEGITQGVCLLLPVLVMKHSNYFVYALLKACFDNSRHSKHADSCIWRVQKEEKAPLLDQICWSSNFRNDAVLLVYTKHISGMSVKRFGSKLSKNQVSGLLKLEIWSHSHACLTAFHKFRDLKIIILFAKFHKKEMVYKNKMH